MTTNTFEAITSGREDENRELSAILAQFTPCADPEKTATVLLTCFGTLKAIFEAEESALARVTSPRTAEKLSSMKPLVKLFMRHEMTDQHQLNNVRELEAYCKSLVVGNRVESFYLISVNAQCRIAGTKCISTGSISEVSAYPRLIVEAALNANAHSVFFCHNHPGGTCAPSAEDITCTLQLKKVLNALNINVLDHMIIAGARVYSMAQHGDVDFSSRTH